MTNNVTHGTNSGSWSGAHSSPIPPKSQTPIVETTIQAQKRDKFTLFTFEDWTIHFQEHEPFAWFVSHDCNAAEGFPHSAAKIGETTIKYGHDVAQAPSGNALCYRCKKELPSETLLILRRTRKFLNLGKKGL